MIFTQWKNVLYDKIVEVFLDTALKINIMRDLAESQVFVTLIQMNSRIVLGLPENWVGGLVGLNSAKGFGSIHTE